MRDSLRSKVIRLAHANPALRPHLLPLVTRTAAGQHPLDPRKAMVYFDLVMKHAEIAQDALDGNGFAIQILYDDGKTRRDIEVDALNNLAAMFGARISNEGYDPRNLKLICKLAVGTWQDVAKINKVIHSHHTGGDDTIDVGVGSGLEYFAAQGFVLFPQGVNGPRYGLSKWIDEHK
jgi:hypothetical protein